MEIERKKRTIRPVDERIAENNAKIERLKELIEKAEEKKKELESLIESYRNSVAQLEQKNTRLATPVALQRRQRMSSPLKGLTLEEFAASMGMTIDEMREKATNALAEKKASEKNVNAEEETIPTESDT